MNAGRILLRGERLAASYAGRPVFAAANLALAAGVHALQGANGSGKSTLLRLLAGAQPADAGEILIDDIALERAPEAARRRLSYVPDQSPVYPFLTGREFLRFVAAAKRAGLDGAAGELAAGLGVPPHLDTRFDAMSLGTQKKLLLVAAWIGEPRVVLLDEPSNGLDQAARDCLAAWLRHRNAGAVIFYASHDADFVAATGASIVSMDDVLAPSRPGGSSAPQLTS
jgi:ABC-type multidrug transport system ATPase subunit